jgi:hypothetical protein
MQIGIKCKELIERCDKVTLFCENKRRTLREKYYQDFHQKVGDNRWSFLGLKIKQKKQETTDKSFDRYLTPFYKSDAPLGKLWNQQVDVERIKRMALKIGKDDDIIYLSDSEATLLEINE